MKVLASILGVAHMEYAGQYIHYTYPHIGPILAQSSDPVKSGPKPRSTRVFNSKSNMRSNRPVRKKHKLNLKPYPNTPWDGHICREKARGGWGLDTGLHIFQLCRSMPSYTIGSHTSKQLDRCLRRLPVGRRFVRLDWRWHSTHAAHAAHAASSYGT